MARYSVIQFMADESTEEVVNIAVVAICGIGVAARIVKKGPDLDRASTFSGVPGEVLQSTARDCVDLVRARAKVSATPLEDLHNEWQNVVRISHPRGSTRSSEAVAEFLGPRFLSKEPSPWQLAAESAPVDPDRACDEALVSALEALTVHEGWEPSWKEGSARRGRGAFQSGVYTHINEEIAIADVQIDRGARGFSFRAIAIRAESSDLYDRIVAAVKRLPLRTEP